MNKEYQNELNMAKKNYYDNKVKQLIKTNPKHWYREQKKLTGFEKTLKNSLLTPLKISLTKHKLN